MLNWIKRLFNKRTKLNKETVVTIDTVLEWTVYIEEYGA